MATQVMALTQQITILSRRFEELAGNGGGVATAPFVSVAALEIPGTPGMPLIVICSLPTDQESRSKAHLSLPLRGLSNSWQTVGFQLQIWEEQDQPP